MTDHLRTTGDPESPAASGGTRASINVDGAVAAVETLRERNDRLATEALNLGRRLAVQECHAAGLEAKVVALTRELARLRPEHPLLAPVGLPSTDTGGDRIGLDVVYRVAFEARVESLATRPSGSAGADG